MHPDDLKTAPQVVVNNVNEKKKTATLYDTSKLKEKDKYALFLGGNYPSWISERRQIQQTDCCL